MRAELNAFNGDWGGLSGVEGITRWFWVDTDTAVTPHGVHVVDVLPVSEPAQVTHVWGWGSGGWLRARVDRQPGAAQGTVRGAVLTQRDDGAHAVETRQAEVWPASDGRVGMGAHPGLHSDPAVVAKVHTVTVTGNDAEDTSVLTSFPFLELAGAR